MYEYTKIPTLYKSYARKSRPGEHVGLISTSDITDNLDIVIELKEKVEL